MLIIPAIDLRQGRCVRLLQGQRDAVTVYDDDPVKVAKSFENGGAEMLHLVDLDGAFSESNERNREIVCAVVQAIKIPVQFGGGLRSFEAIEKALSLGIGRVVLGTLAAESKDALSELVQSFGPHRIVVAIDAHRDKVLTRGWESGSQLSALTLAQQIASAGVARIVYTDVERDGMLTGTNIDRTRAIAQASHLKVTASGGVSSLADLERLKSLSAFGVDSVIVGKALYEGRFSLAEAILAGR